MDHHPAHEDLPVPIPHHRDDPIVVAADIEHGIGGNIDLVGEPAQSCEVPRIQWIPPTPSAKAPITPSTSMARRRFGLGRQPVTRGSGNTRVGRLGVASKGGLRCALTRPMGYAACRAFAVGVGTGPPNLRQASSQATIASCISRNASNSVAPQAQQPGKSGAVAI
jgi:hypothetical protein